jgi:hypothetical protein
MAILLFTYVRGREPVLVHVVQCICKYLCLVYVVVYLLGNVLAIAAMLCSYKMVSQMLFEAYGRCSCCKESPSLLPHIQNPKYSDNPRTYQYSRS